LFWGPYRGDWAGGYNELSPVMGLVGIWGVERRKGRQASRSGRKMAQKTAADAALKEN